MAQQNPQQKFEPAVLQEAERIRQRTDEARKIFNLVDTEVVIEDYLCSIRKAIPIAGRMYITQNYVCFSSFIGGICEVLPYRKITAIVPQTFMFFNSGIDIDVDNIKYQFANYNMREQTLNLLKYLWKHPPSYLTDAPTEPPKNNLSSSSSNDGANYGANTGGYGGYGVAGASRDFEFNRGGAVYESQQQQELVVDVDTSLKAIEIALETKDIGQSTLEELNRQAEILDNIERDVEHIHMNLDRGDRYIRSMEGVGGAIKNIFSNNKPSHNTFEKKDHTVVLQRKPKNVDYNVLIKNPDQNFTPCLLRFSDESFYFASEDGTKPITGKEWKYGSFVGLVVNSRHLHAELRLAGKVILRLVSSYLQAITNEVVLRTEPGQVTVVFEPHSKSFQYGSFRLSDKLEAAGIGRANAVNAANPHGKASDILSTNVSQKVKDDFDQQDQNLQILENLVDEISDMSKGMQNELVGQTERIGHITNRVAEAQNHTAESTRRAKRI
eukprot:TRINITY_DN2755_c0_g1_i1.p1 TRINITY_DN2755_c0_g1~~TRINITY_DN2755_c0_g1_i1.p1  ORF type:complete len:497 (-),score=93.07 TRINITY_DN2755_c0_g1_i1:120-1610(-)